MPETEAERETHIQKYKDAIFTRLRQNEKKKDSYLILENHVSRIFSLLFK